MSWEEVRLARRFLQSYPDEVASLVEGLAAREIVELIGGSSTADGAAIFDPHEREPSGRVRWLTGGEIEAFEQHCPPEWWPYFAAKFYTGARAKELGRLRGMDVLIQARRLAVHEEEGPTKTPGSVRDLSVNDKLAPLLAEHYGIGPTDVAVEGDFQNDTKIRRVWDRICDATGIEGATPRDTRHTFGVHCAMAGIPPTEIRDLLGHTSLAMTMRYMQYAPTARLDEDAARILRHMSADSEGEERRRLIVGGV